MEEEEEEARKIETSSLLSGRKWSTREPVSSKRRRDGVFDFNFIFATQQRQRDENVSFILRVIIFKFIK